MCVGFVVAERTERYREEFAVLAASAHIPNYVFLQILIIFWRVALVQDGILSFLHTDTPEEILAVKAVIAILQVRVVVAQVAEKNLIVPDQGVGLVGKFYFLRTAVDVHTTFRIDSIHAVFDVFPAVRVETNQGVFGIEYIVSRGINGLLDGGVPAQRVPGEHFFILYV